MDRDGTVVEERGYITRADDLVPIPGVESALSSARDAGVVVVLVTNQSAVGRGLLDAEALARLHHALAARLALDGVYACPHLPDAGCACRKPAPGMIRRAIDEHDLDPARTLLLGDHITDCEAARAAGIDAVLVRTGHGADHEAEALAAGFRVVDDVSAGVRLLLDRLGR